VLLVRLALVAALLVLLVLPVERLFIY
jgi:hypothetical protein